MLLHLVMAWAALALAAGAGIAIVVARGATRPDAARLPRLLSVGVLALGLRIVLSPHTLLNENAHGYEFLQAAFSGQGHFYHGAGSYAFFHALTSLLGRSPEVVFHLNALLGAIAAMVMLPLARHLTGDGRASWLAGCGLACWPQALRIGASESMFPLAVLSGLLAWWAWLAAWKRGGTARFLLAAALLAFAVQVRPVMALWPLVLLLSLPLCPGWTRHLRSRAPWIAAASLAALLSGWAFLRLSILAAEGVPEMVGRVFTSLVLLASRDNLIFNPTWTPAVALALALLGLATLALRGRLVLAPLLGGLLALGLFVLAAGEGMAPAQLRLQSPMQPLFILLVAAGGGWLAGRAAPRWRLPAIIAIGCLLAGNALAGSASIRRAFNPQLEYAFLARTVPGLPAGCTIVTAPRFLAGGVISTEFPTWWREPESVLEAGVADDSIPDDGCVLVYQGLSCFRFTPQESAPVDGLRPECRALSQRWDLEPLVWTSFPSRPYHAHQPVHARLVEIGFSRVIPGTSGPGR